MPEGRTPRRAATARPSLEQTQVREQPALCIRQHHTASPAAPAGTTPPRGRNRSPPRPDIHPGDLPSAVHIALITDDYDDLGLDFAPAEANHGSARADAGRGPGPAPMGGARLCGLVKAGNPAGQKRFAANDQ
ncbi:hypothetical protein ABT300_42250 [Streptomyces sp. NPDC001027]|uniref:hypothetical protein n=1 Tax=Streptomyces sp. NPDC001027 TaxID=3154771 RepID=UPI00332A79BA